MTKTKKMVLTGLLAAIASAIYMFLPEIPIVPGVSYLKIDLSGFPAVVAAVIIGPWHAIAVELLRNIIHLSKSTTLGIGELMNFIVGVAFALPFAFIRKKFASGNRTISYTAASIVACVSAVVLGLAANFAFVPIYFRLMHIPFESAVYISFVLGSIPLNIAKGISTAVITVPILEVLRKTAPEFS